MSPLSGSFEGGCILSRQPFEGLFSVPYNGCALPITDGGVGKNDQGSSSSHIDLFLADIDLDGRNQQAADLGERRH